MDNTFIPKGMELVKQAVVADNANDLVTAFSLYKQGLQYFMTGLKYVKNERSKEAIRIKVDQYMARAEELKAAIDKQSKRQKKKEVVAGGLPTTSTGEQKGPLQSHAHAHPRTHHTRSDLSLRTRFCSCIGFRLLTASCCRCRCVGSPLCCSASVCPSLQTATRRTRRWILTRPSCRQRCQVPSSGPPIISTQHSASHHPYHPILTHRWCVMVVLVLVVMAVCGVERSRM